MDKKKRYSVDITFRGEANNLYSLGYLSNDIYQLAVFSDLLEKGQAARAEKIFGPKVRPLNRYNSELSSKTEIAKIIESRNGSTILTIGGLTLGVTIILGVTQLLLPTVLKHFSDDATFEIAVNDERIAKLLDAYQRKEFGKGQLALDTLWMILREWGYSVKVLSDNTYLIEKVIDRYAQRMVRTISKNK